MLIASGCTKLATAAMLHRVSLHRREGFSGGKLLHDRDSSGLQDQTKHISITTITLIGD